MGTDLTQFQHANFVPRVLNPCQKPAFRKPARDVEQQATF